MKPTRVKRFSDTISRVISSAETQGGRRAVRFVLAIVLILPVVSIAAFSLWKINGDLNAIEYQRRQALAELAAITITEKFDHLSNLGQSYATRILVRQYSSQKQWDKAIEAVKSIPIEFTFIERVFITDPAGIEQADFPALPGAVGRDFSFRDWYRGVTAEWKPYVSNVYRRAALPQYNVVAIAAPILSDDGTPLAILVLQVKLDTFFDWMRDLNVSAHGVVYITDREGNIAMHPAYPPQSNIISYATVPAVQEALGGRQGIEISNNPVENGERLAAYAPVSAYGWAVVVSESAEQAFALKRNDLLISALIFGAILVLNICVALFILYIMNALNSYRQKERLFLESIGDGVAAIDRSFTITLWNRSAAALTDYNPAEAVGKPLRSVLKLIRERDRKEDIRFVEDVMLYGKPQIIEERMFLVTKSGQEIPVGDSAAPIMDENGTVTGAIIVFRDASKEREAQQIKSDFTYAAHQFRTPVTKALWNIETALETKKASERAENLKTAYTSLKSVAKLASELIDLAELEQGRAAMKPERLDVGKLIAEISDLNRPRATVWGLGFDAPAPEKGLAVHADKKMLATVFNELIENAIIYNKKDGSISVTARPDGSVVTFEIHDSGIGIIQKEQPLIFTKFFRGSNFDTTNVIGGGLGLALANGYVKLMGGKMWFTSSPDEGTSFFIQLPKA